MLTNRNLSYPVFQIRSRSIVQYQEYVYARSGSHRLKLSNHMKEVRENYKAYSGTMTAGAKKRLTKAVSLLVQSSKDRVIYNEVSRTYHQFKLSFLTLTIPLCENRPDAKFCNKYLLEPMIRVLRRRYGLKSYIWKLELQQNGMVHYHLTTNLFINHSHLKNEWNNILRRNNLLDDYKTRTGKDDPNSTDIKSVRQIKDFEAYLIKYIAKDEQNKEKVNAKIWDCSLNLKKADYFKTEATWSYSERLQELERKGSISVFAGERFIVYRFTKLDIRSFLTADDLNNYKLHLKHIGNGQIQKQKDKYDYLRPSIERDNAKREKRDTAPLYKIVNTSLKNRTKLDNEQKRLQQRLRFSNHQTLYN